MRGNVGLRGVVFRSLLVGLGCCSTLAVAPVWAQIQRPFTVRFTANARGDLVMLGNTLLSCPTADPDCPAARLGLGNRRDNNNFFMVYVDADADPTTFNSSEAQLVLPPGATILWAGLYWGGDHSKPTNGSLPPNPTLRDRVQFATPSAGYATVVANQLDDLPLTAPVRNFFQGFADVTAAVQAGGAGTYRVANLQSATGENRYGGWALIVVLGDPTNARRNLTVFDGFAQVTASTPVSVTASGFVTPALGAFTTRFGQVSWEGDIGNISGDQLTINGDPVSDAVNPLGNTFNSTISRLGTHVAAKSPNYVNQLGMDIDYLDVTGLIPNNSTSATLGFVSSADQYLPGVAAFVADLADSADVQVTKTGPASVAAIANYSYAITLQNNGPGDAGNVVVTDTLPPGAVFVSATNGGTHAGGVVTWPSIPALSNGASQVYSVTVTAPAMGTLTNIVAAQSVTPDPLPANNDGSAAGSRVVTAVIAAADVVTTKTGPATVNSLGTVVYSVSVANTGPSSAADVVVTDTLPAGVSFVSASGGGTHAAGVVTWPAIASLANGANQNFTVTVTAPATGALTNIVASTSTTGDPNAANNDGTAAAARVTTAVIPTADVAVTKTGPATIVAGGNISYTVTVSNIGPNSASGVVVTDTLPAGAAFLAASGGGTLSGGVVTWPVIASLPSGGSTSFVLAVVAPGAGVLTNIAAATSTSNDPDPTNNNGAAPTSRVTTTVSVIPTADLAVSKTGPATAIVGATVAYSITVENLGAAVAADVAVTDTLPAGAAFVSATGGPTLTGSVLAWPLIPALGAGAVQTFTVMVTLPTTGTFTNIAAGVSTTPDPNAANNNGSLSTGRVVTVVSAVADVAVIKTGPATVAPGGTIDYTVTVSNAGPSPAADVVLTDTLPGTATFVFASGGAVRVGNVLTWPTIPVLAPGGNAAFTVRVIAPATGALTNVAAAVSPTPDPTPGNNDGSASSSRVVTAVVSVADVAATKSGPSTVAIGATFSYGITVANAGPGAATSVVVTDTLPAGVTFVNATAGGVLTGNVVTWPTILSLANGASQTFTVTVTAAGSGVLTNVVAAAATSTDPAPANNNGSASASRVTTTVTGDADVVVTKVGPAGVDPGGSVTYTITVGNNGPNLAQGVVVSDTLPASVTFVEASNAGVLSGRVVSWPAIGSLGVGQTIVHTVMVRAPAGGSFTNIVAAAAVSPDPNAANNNGSAPGARPTTVVRPIDVAIQKTHVGDLTVGTEARYAIVVTNVGLVPTTGPMTVIDTVASSLSVVSASGAGWSCQVAGRVVTCVFAGALPPAAAVGFNLDVQVGVGAGASVVNRAYVSTPGDDAPGGNNVSTDAATVTGLSPLVLEKRALRADVEVGDLVDYELLVSNVAAGSVAGVVVVDTLPLGFVYVAGSGRRDGAVVEPAGTPGPVLGFAVGSLPANSTVTLRYRLRVGAGAGAGSGENRAFARSEPTGVQSPLAFARVRFRNGLLGDRAFIVGKVALRFDGAGGARELGIPGVRVVLTDGSSAVTDDEGKYSFYGLPPLLHVVHVDATTLPEGVRLSVTGNRQLASASSRMVDLKKGELHAADFFGRGGADAVAAVRARRAAGQVEGAIADTTPARVEGDRAVSDAPGTSGIGRDRADSTFIRGVYQPLTGDLSEPIAERNGIGRVQLADRAIAAGPGGRRLTLGLPSGPVPADGQTLVAVRVRLLGPGGDPVAGATAVTLESSLGRWQVADRDGSAPGIQAELTDGEATFGLVAPAGDGLGEVRVTAGALGQTGVVAFVPAARPLIATGFVQGRIDLKTLMRGALVTATPSDGFEQELSALASTSDDGLERVSGRSALYLRGKIKGDMLLTVAYDTERDPEAALFRDIRPEEFYPVYGDASIREYGAQSSERLYVRIDKQRNYFLYGDYVTPAPSDARELGAYMRSLTGAVQHFESEQGELDAFASRSRNRQIVDELAGRGISGPYQLSRRDALVNSERVELVTRDRHQPSRLLRIEPMRRFVDYSMEPFTGRLLFRRPVPSVDGDLNPVSVRVTYELEAGGESQWIYGATAKLRAGRRVELGGGFVQEEDPLDSFQLFTLNGAVRMGPGTTLLAEWARTDGNARDAGVAARVELRHHSERVDLQMFAVQSDSVYANPSSSFGGGRRELGGTFALGLTDGTRLLGHALRSEDRRTDATRDGALVAIEQRFGAARLELGYRYGRETAEPVGPTTAGATPNETNAAHARLTLDVGDTLATGLRRASLFAEYDQDVHDAERRRGAFGAQVQVLRRMRLYGRHEFLSSFAGPFALNGEQESQATVFGFDAGYADDGQVFSEYRLRDGLAGRDGEAVIGLRNRWTLARGLRLDASFERIHPTSGPASLLEEATAVTGALDVSTSPDWRATARLEYRDATRANTWLATLGYAHKLSSDWTVLGRVLWNDLDQSQVRARGQLGLAWRQTDGSAWNGLARLERTFERMGVATVGAEKRAVTLGSAHASWRPTDQLTISGRWASKWATDSTGGAPEVTSRADLGMLRFVQDIGSTFDIGGQGSVLRTDGSAGRRFGVGGELGVRLGVGARLAVGYNLFGFRDRDLRDTEYTIKGVYFRFDYLFDERLFGGGAER